MLEKWKKAICFTMIREYFGIGDRDEEGFFFFARFE